jgi:demethylmenaquinone methyltransferase/2-methoxy-6-polyprenyl-1,4-benzoquinol methylase
VENLAKLSQSTLSLPGRGKYEKNSQFAEATSLYPDRKVRFVMRLFSKGAREYDFLLRILSLGRDRFWRESVVKESGMRSKRGARILDIACGTGLLSFEFARKGALVVGVDVTREMLDRAKELDLTRRVEFVQARAETLPFRNDAFDAATISLATRNLSSVEKSFAEMYRCTKRNGSVISMDFVRPIERTFSAFYLFYIFRILPAFGLLVSRHWNGIFVYLANSIARSKSPEQLASILSKVGAQSTKVTRMTHGVTAIVSGQKI